MENNYVNNFDNGSFYSSDEDVAWGPVSIREIKHDLKRKPKIKGMYRRRTVQFYPCSSDKHILRTSPDSSSSTNQDYCTANETLESKVMNDEKHSCHERGGIICHNSSANSSSTSNEHEDYSYNIEIKQERISKYSNNVTQESVSNFIQLDESVCQEDVIILSSGDEELHHYEVCSEEPIGVKQAENESYSDHNEKNAYFELTNQNCPLILFTPATPLVKMTADTEETSSSNDAQQTLGERYDEFDGVIPQVSESPQTRSSESILDISTDIEEHQDFLDDTIENMKRVLHLNLELSSDEADDFEDFQNMSRTCDSSCNINRTCDSSCNINNELTTGCPSSEKSNYRLSEVTNNFKIPEAPSRLPKRIPTPNQNREIISPKKYKSIVSPVRLYINNSPHPVLKQNVKSTVVQTQLFLHDITDSQPLKRKHKNIVPSLPEVVYKPSKQVIENRASKTIMPKSIQKLIKERCVIKHINRTNLFLHSMNEGNLSCFVVDDINVSVHTTQQGLSK